jgi:hypothetical protein
MRTDPVTITIATPLHTIASLSFGQTCGVSESHTQQLLAVAAT